MLIFLDSCSSNALHHAATPSLLPADAPPLNNCHCQPPPYCPVVFVVLLPPTRPCPASYSIIKSVTTSSAQGVKVSKGVRAPSPPLSLLILVGCNALLKPQQGLPRWLCCCHLTLLLLLLLSSTIDIPANPHPFKQPQCRRHGLNQALQQL
jgi:hypothetical protein